MSKRQSRANVGTRRHEPRRGMLVVLDEAAQVATSPSEERYTTLEGFLAGLYGLDPAGVADPGPRALVEQIQRLTQGKVMAREAVQAEPTPRGEILANLLGKDDLEIAFYATQEGDPHALTNALLASLSRLEQRAGAPS